jgi:hypothetical protein
LITQTPVAERTVSAPGGLELVAIVRRYAVPGFITALVLVGALLGPSALAAPGGEVPGGARLDGSWGYVVMAPVTSILDTLSLLTLDQHYAVLATLILFFVAWRVFRRRARRGWLRRSGIEVGIAVLALAGLVAFYGYGILGPRPMVALAVEDPEVVVVDVHSHTDRSHDGRPGFDAEDNREWHASAGFDAVYVSDHRTWQGYAEGSARNPERAGEGTVLLPALENVFAGKYASALGESWRYRRATEGNILIADSIDRMMERGVPRPTLVLTVPGGLDDVPASTPDSVGYVAIEVSDASPRGLQQSRRDRALLLRMADSLDLAPVAGSNNHGWGRTAAAWTLVRIPGWRAMTPRALGQAIEARFHADRRAASTVVERRAPYPGESPVALALTVPAITWQLFGGIGLEERLSWLAWTWLVALILVPRLRGRRRPVGLR